MNFLLLLFLYVVWGTTYTAIPYALEGLTPLALASARFTLCGLLFMPFSCRGDWDPRKAWPLILCGIFHSCSNVIMIWSMQKIPSGLASLFIGSVPVWFLLMNWIFWEKKRPSWTGFVGVFVGVSGVGFLSYATGKDLTLRMSALGLLVAPFLFCTGTMVARKTQALYSNFASLSVQLFSGGCLTLIIAIILGEDLSAFARLPSWRPAVAFLYLLLVGSFLAMAAFNHLIQHLPAHVVGTYAFVNPLVAMLLGQWLLREDLSPDMLMAGALILGGVAMILYRPSGSWKQ